MWADVHCHFDYFENPAEIIVAAEKAGVKRIIANSTTLEGLHKCLALKMQFPKIISVALGYHPTHIFEDSASKREETMNHIIQHASEAIAFGEVGLDFDEQTSKEEKELQVAIFKKFILLSKEFKKPLIVHARGSRAEVLRILQEENAQKVLLHSFVCKEKQMKDLLKTSFFVSVGAGVLNSEWIQKFAQELPLEKLLLETDSPLEFSGEQCSSVWIPRIASKIAELKGIQAENVQKAAEKNFQALFGKN
ncbi:MAG: TatD family hydrolase [Candidatus Diapherotrites archaeon]|nr:TatD family hydrolase [Candidatus Diapherotrites archaeon]